MKLPLEGGCRCDAVRIRATEAPIVTGACHCTGCQRMASSAFSLTAIFLANGFSVTKGETVIGGARSAELDHFFCGHCMTWMFTRPKGMDHVVNVRATMFDDHTWFKPFLETFTKTKLSFVDLGAVRSYEEFPPPESYEALMTEYQAFAKG